MSENCSKSKLRRKKSSVDELHSGGEAKRSSSTSGDGGAKPAGPALAAAAAAAWWETPRPPAVESLWAFTLMSALPYLKNQHWDPVPDLPLPPAVKLTAPDPDERRWCDLRREVPPFPESSLLSLKSPQSPDPPSPASSQQDLPVPDLKSPDQSLKQLTESPQLPAVRRREEAAASSAGRQSIREEEEVPDEEEDVRRDEGAALHSCPMCLQMFPPGFTQMDRDGHLAQCLSDMNMDMTW